MPQKVHHKSVKKKKQKCYSNVKLAFIVNVKIVQRPEKMCLLVFMSENLQQSSCQRSTVVTARGNSRQRKDRLKIFG